MLKLFRNTIGHLLSSQTRMSRQIRRKMKNVKDIADGEEFEEKWQKLGSAMDLGDADTVGSLLEEEMHLILELGEVELLEQEENLIAMEWKYSKNVLVKNKIGNFLDLIEQKLTEKFGDHAESVIPGLPETKEKLKKVHDEAQSKLKNAYEKADEEIKNQYNAFFEQEREEQEHRFMNRARGVAKLARAMRDTYKLRHEYKEGKASVEEMERIEHHLYVALEKVHEEVEGNVNDLEEIKLGQTSQKLVEHQMKKLRTQCQSLTRHIEEVFTHFTEITRIFVEYFFMLKGYAGLIEAGLDKLEKMGYPEHELEQLREKKHTIDEKIHEHEKTVADATARIHKKVHKAS